MQFVGSIVKGLVVLISGASIALGTMFATRSESAFTHNEVARINPVMVVDSYTLISTSNFNGSMSYSVGQLIARGVLVETPFGFAINEDLHSRSMAVIIQSGGGRVDLGYQLVDSLKPLREAGIKIDCYVGEAQSMAFYIMVTACDRVIAKKSATLMQHRVSYGLSGVTPATYLMDIELSRVESAILEVSYDEWHNLVRGEEDHVFTPEEIKKYKLVDEWID